MEATYVIGVDFGTDSVRSLIANAINGNIEAEAIHYYTRWKEQKYCNSSQNLFRQHPLDYLEGIKITLKEIISKVSPKIVKNIKAISIDTTGSTPVAIDSHGMPLALHPDFRENPNAMFVLWKDHTAVEEAEEINNMAKTWGGEDFTKYSGGIYSSEWFWAKILHIIKSDEKIKNAAYSWVEHCDWMPAVLTGNTKPLTWKRSRCAAGHKAMWNKKFNGLPSKDYLTTLHPYLANLKDRLYVDTYTVDKSFGNLSKEWAEKLGLSTNVKVGVGALDAHIGAVGAQIEPYSFCRVMGTSTCDMLIVPNDATKNTLVKGICGQVDGSIVPNMLGMEAGQSAFGDIYTWFKDIISFPLHHIIANSNIIEGSVKDKLINETSNKIITYLSKEATKIETKDDNLMALDWLNGRRTPDANQKLKGAITGLTLGSNAPRIFKALVDATVFGSKKIIDRFVSEGIKINSVIALGGVAKKSPLVMQTLTDVLNVKIKVANSEQTCALGAAMCAATVAGIYKKLEHAQHAMGAGFDKEYTPLEENVKKYETLYSKYEQLATFIENSTK